MYCDKIFIILIAALTVAVANANYCDTELLCPFGKHIACNNNGAFSPNCINPQIIQITPQYREQILREHNEYRNQIAKGFHIFPPAARMGTMVWDEELAKLAELNVKQCEMNHDQCHNTARFKQAGQNLAFQSWIHMDMPVSKPISDAIKGWFDEYEICPANIMEKFSYTRGSYLHFLTMIQDKCTHVGCAIIRYEKEDFTYQLMACNYANVVITDTAIYKIGAPTSACKTNTNPEFRYLCSVREKY